jgi:hypothetical protein
MDTSVSPPTIRETYALVNSQLGTVAKQRASEGYVNSISVCAARQETERLEHEKLGRNRVRKLDAIGFDR